MLHFLMLAILGGFYGTPYGLQAFGISNPRFSVVPPGRVLLEAAVLVQRLPKPL